MPIYDLFIYDRYGQCLVHKPFNQPPPTQQSTSTSTNRSKLIFGLVYTMQAFVNKFSYNLDTSTQLPQQEPLLSFNTPQHKVHYLSSPTGLKFVLTTDLKFPTATDLLKRVYKLYVDYVISTPHYTQGVALVVVIVSRCPNCMKTCSQRPASCRLTQR
jgi:hypothetical protein